MNTTINNQPETKKDSAIIVRGGMGGFLNPPTHPQHEYSVEYDLQRSKDNRSSMSLSAASTCDYISTDARLAVTKMLTDWKKNKPDIKSDEIIDWINEVLSYFKHCYSPDGKDRNVSNCLIDDKKTSFKKIVNHHLGVLYIREYYPNWKPTKLQTENL